MKYLPDHPVDVLFLDIQMPELNGLEFSRMVSEDTRIIFTTAFDQYALDGYRVNALDYLLKPISYSDFMEAINKAVKWFELQQKADKQSTEGDSDENKKDYIYVKSDYKLIQIELNKILYIEGLKDYIKIHLENEDRPNPVIGQHACHGRKASGQPVYPCTPVFYRTETENKSYRQRTNRIRKRLYSDL